MLIELGKSGTNTTPNCLQKILKQMKQLSIGLLIILLSSACTVVKEYNKIAINDQDMQLSAFPCERFETNFQIYREAAAGANGGKTGGGCGCN